MLRRIAPALLRDGIGIVGVVGIAYGAWLITPAAGFITGGTSLVAVAILLGVNSNRAAGQ